MFDFRRAVAGLCLSAATLAASAGVARATPQAFRGESALRPLVTGIPRLPLRLPAKKSHGKIKHVVIIMQENRSFDDLFQGYPGANTQSYGYDSRNDKVTLAPIPLEAPYDLNHDFDSFITCCN